jgi:hypothetical protein
MMSLSRRQKEDGRQINRQDAKVAKERKRRGRRERRESFEPRMEHGRNTDNKIMII